MSKLTSFGDTLQTVDDLWAPRYDTMRTSRSESGAERMSESGGSTISRGSLDSQHTPVKIARRAPPARKPLPTSRRSSASSAMGNKDSKLDAVHRNSSPGSSVQHPLSHLRSARQDPTPTSSTAAITGLNITPPGSFSLREELELGFQDADVSPEGHASLAQTSTESPSRLARSHSRGKSNTALHILDSFPVMQNGIYTNIYTSRKIPSSRTETYSVPLTVPPHANIKKPTTAVPPLTVAHQYCYHAHRTMQFSRNIYAPVPCMTCYLEDQEPRWKCTWCCLRICRQCLGLLENNRGRELAELVSSVRK
ncbi:hypothetical protein MMC16_002295 [Acarospora aff. strigata]|nr:hypothetical protein [Acarospora aff. strigata]